MKDLILRLSALDPEAGAALRAITYFDALAAARPGLPAVVRGAVTLTGAAAGFLDPHHRTGLRVDERGQARHDATPPDPRWLSATVGEDGALLWLERMPPARTIDAVVLERAAALTLEVLDRTHGRDRRETDETEWAEVLVDAGASERIRRHAAHQLRLPLTGLARAVALPGSGVRIQAATDGSADASPAGRAGIGPAVPVLDLPASWARARLALRLTAAGTPADPGPRIVHAEQMGGLALLAQHVGPDTPLTPDETALHQAATAAPWMLATLEAVASTTSRRAAAARLVIHHSSLQERLARAERYLGWPITEAHGRLRLQLALVLRRLHRPEP
ncbi:helix-turn-helix domain-containing protein [Georgenia sp. TF02-10]|uniref:helix-turn-helix domain-containing protein n=1 Tax=Georgenia sp. TF02-10 TaxID=2917725 RepID=UPI001FA7F0F4|nr:helix-turn-helix domain-containing protein [Georgenia sp. TF02-10]UNX53537.1 helix-turn-helix domain-containing protein [Georgenia sp. TF02-10]